MALNSWLTSLKLAVSDVSAVQPSNHAGYSRYGTETAGVSDVSAEAETMRPDTADTAAKMQAYQRKPAPVLACTPDTADTAEKINTGANAANELLTSDLLTQASDTDRWAWPHSTAANTTELALMTRRLAHFDRLGLDIDTTERQADMLLIRDREADDRRSCLECSNLTGHGRTWNCRAARQRGARGAGLPVDYVQTLTRCNAWMAQQGRF